jgi:hypothetical protein
MAPLLEYLNNKLFQKLPGCRASVFAAIDAPALMTLPLEPFELAVTPHGQQNRQQIGPPKDRSMGPARGCLRGHSDLPPPSHTSVNPRKSVTMANDGHEKKQIHGRTDHRIHQAG